MQKEEICIIGKFVCKISRKIRKDLWSMQMISVEDPTGIDAKNQKRDNSVKKERYLCKIGGVDLPIVTGLEVKYYGYNNVQKGYFVVTRYEYMNPHNTKGLVKLLCSKAFKGIGKATAEKLVNKYNVGVLELLKNKNEKEIAQIVGPAKAKILHDSYDKIKGIGEIQAILSTYNIPGVVISKIWDKYREKAVEIANTNPFIFMEVEGFGFTSADKIARAIGMKMDDPRRVEATTLFSLEAVLINNSGDLWAEKSEVISKTLEYLQLNDSSIVETALKQLAAQEKVAIRGNRCIYPMRFEKAEYNTCQKALKLLTAKTDIVTNKVIAEEVMNYNKKYNATLSEKQLLAVKKSLTNKFSIITGGPGTGKTTIVNAIIRIYQNVYGSGSIVTLLSPTGKAAQRMTEVCGIQAKTIHSKLKIFNENQKSYEDLDEGLIIVDESSMLDMMLTEKLLHAVPFGSHLILVGDIDQLPSVGAGSVLKDFIDSGAIPTSRLTETFRQKGGSLIIDNAQKINRGDTSLVYDEENYIYKQVKDEDDAVNKIVDLYLEEAEKVGADNVAVLCPRRRMTLNNFKVTTEYLNGVIQDKVNPFKKEDTVFEQNIDGRNVQYRIGSRVMQTKNCESSSNGDIGIIKDINEEGVVIDWDNGNTVTQNFEEMETIVLGYALTVHKSQGSEYKSVIIPLLSDQKGPLFRRNLLYTAVTRAKKKVIMVGDEPVNKTNSCTNYCITHSDIGSRKTLFTRRLITNAERMKL